MIISAYSDRIYKNSINENLYLILKNCNDTKIELYAHIKNGKLNLCDLNTTYIITNYQINTYFANMIIREVKALLSSNEELQSIYIDDISQQIENQVEKINNLSKKLEYWKNMKQEILNFIKDSKNKIIFPYIFKNDKVIIKNKIYSLQEFEYYTNNRIHWLKSNIYNSKNKLNRLKQKLENMKLKTPICCLGSKQFFKKQFTIDKYINNHQLWKDEFQLKRHYHFTISGSKNHIDGSMCVRYDKNKKILHIMSHKQGTISNNKKYAKQEWFQIPCIFKYKEKEYLEALQKRDTIAYEILDKGNYFIIKAVFEYENPNQLNNYIENGINALDINVDRFALIELDNNGNLLKRKVIPFQLDGLSSNQATKLLEKIVLECVDFCKQNNKPLVREDIKKIKFKVTKDNKTNKKLTQFAYNKMINTIDRCFYKNNIEVFKINPSYTSQQGKLKYMQRLGLSIHESAAMCIGRRFLFSNYDDNGNLIKLYYENMLQYERFGTIKQISKAFQKLRTNDIYKLNKLPINIINYKKLNQYIKDINNYLHNN